MSSLTPSRLRAIIRQHDMYWRAQRPKLRTCRALYHTEYYDQSARDATTSLAEYGIELSRGYEFVQGYMASLFSRSPGVIAKEAIDGKGNKDVAQSIGNHFIAQFRPELEAAARAALIYPNCAMKLAICDDYDDAFSGIEAAVIMPWDLLVDRQASSWAKQRYIGHRYWMPVEDANEKWGCKLIGKPMVQFLDNMLDDGSADEDSSSSSHNNDTERFILVYEIYDMRNDKLLLWCEEHMQGAAWLYDGAEFTDESGTTKYDKIPFRTARDKPVCPIVPLYFGHRADEALLGYSTLGRVADQISELIEARRFQAKAVRKCGRQLLSQEGVLEAPELAKYAAGDDGELILVAKKFVDVDVRTLITPIPMQPAPPEVEEYVGHVESDIQRASMMNGMVYGQPNGGTATEVTAQAAYSNALVGEMARERDEMITGLCTVVVALMRVMLDGGEAEVVLLDGETMVIHDSDLAGSFKFFALDGGGTPQTSMQKLNDLRNDTPMLLDMGVPKRALLEKRLHLMGMPELMPKVTDQAVAQSAPQTEAPAPNVPEAGTQAAVDEGGLGLSPGALPSPDKIQAVLPQS